MGGQSEAYALLAVSVVVVGAGLCLLLLLAGGLLRALAVPVRARLQPDRAAEQPLVVRRCEACGKAWRTRAQRHLSLPRLLTARTVRHGCTARGWEVPVWARPQGWTRCPSCLSTRVRTSGGQALPAPLAPAPRRSVLVGTVAVGLGVLLISAATIGYVNRAPAS